LDAEDLMPESGLSVGPDELGQQFLKDATDQDNFESTAPELIDPREAAVAQLEAEGHLEPGVDDENPTSRTLAAEEATETEPSSGNEVDLLSNSIHGGSLFDQPTSRGQTRAPDIRADESERVGGDARERAQREELAALLRFRRRPTTARKRRVNVRSNR